MQKVLKHMSRPGHSFGAQVLVTVGTAGFLNVLGLLTGVLAARLLGPAGRGELAAIQLWGAFFATLALVGLSEAVVFFASRSPGYARQYWISGTCFALITGLPVILLGFWALPWLLQAQSADVVTTARWYSLGLFVLFALSWMPLSAFRALQRVSEWNFLRILPNLGWLIVLGLGFILSGASPRVLAYGFLVAYAVMGASIFVLSIKKIPGPFLPKIDWWPSMVKYGLPLMFSSIPTYLIQNGRLSQLFLAAFLSPQALGLFAVAIAWANISRIVPQAIGQITFPRVASGVESSVQIHEIAKGLRLTVVSMVGVCGILLVTAPVAIPALFGKAFSPAVPAAMILVVAGGVAGLRMVLSSALRGLGKPKRVLVGEVVGLGVTTLGLVLLLGPFRLLGAAAAILVGDTIAMVLLLTFVTHAVNASSMTLLVPTVADLRALTLMFRKGVALIR